MIPKVFSRLLKKSLKINHYSCRGRVNKTSLCLEFKKPVLKDIFLRDFDLDFDTYLCSILTNFHTSWYQNVIHTWTNLQLSAAGLFKYYAFLLTPGMKTLKNCRNMIFSALRTFLVFHLSENINGTTAKVWNPVVLLFWFWSYR